MAEPKLPNILEQIHKLPFDEEKSEQLFNAFYSDDPRASFEAISGVPLSVKQKLFEIRGKAEHGEPYSLEDISVSVKPSKKGAGLAEEEKPKEEWVGPKEALREREFKATTAIPVVGKSPEASPTPFTKKKEVEVDFFGRPVQPKTSKAALAPKLVKLEKPKPGAAKEAPSEETPVPATAPPPVVVKPKTAEPPKAVTPTEESWLEQAKKKVTGFVSSLTEGEKPEMPASPKLAQAKAVIEQVDKPILSTDIKDYSIGAGLAEKYPNLFVPISKQVDPTSLSATDTYEAWKEIGANLMSRALGVPVSKVKTDISNIVGAQFLDEAAKTAPELFDFMSSPGGLGYLAAGVTTGKVRQLKQLYNAMTATDLGAMFSEEMKRAVDDPTERNIAKAAKALGFLVLGVKDQIKPVERVPKPAKKPTPGLEPPTVEAEFEVVGKEAPKTEGKPEFEADQPRRLPVTEEPTATAPTAEPVKAAAEPTVKPTVAETFSTPGGAKITDITQTSPEGFTPGIDYIPETDFIFDVEGIGKFTVIPSTEKPGSFAIWPEGDIAPAAVVEGANAKEAFTSFIDKPAPEVKVEAPVTPTGATEAPPASGVAAPTAKPPVEEPKAVTEPPPPVVAAAPPMPAPAPVQPPASAAKKQPAKPLWEMGIDELETLDKELIQDEKNTLVELFGEEGAKKYKQLERSSNSSNHEKADRAAAQMAEMEESLNEEQLNRLYGGHLQYSPEDVRDYIESINSLDFSSEEDLGRSIRTALTSVGQAKTPEAMTSTKEQIAWATMKQAMEGASERGFDLEKVIQQALASAWSRFSDPEDAAFMLRRFMKKQTGPGEKPTPAAPPTKALLAPPQPALPAPTAPPPVEKKVSKRPAKKTAVAPVPEVPPTVEPSVTPQPQVVEPTIKTAEPPISKRVSIKDIEEVGRTPEGEIELAYGKKRYQAVPAFSGKGYRIYDMESGSKLGEVNDVADPAEALAQVLSGK